MLSCCIGRSDEKTTTRKSDVIQLRGEDEKSNEVAVKKLVKSSSRDFFGRVGSSLDLSKLKKVEMGPRTQSLGDLKSSKLEDCLQNSEFEQFVKSQLAMENLLFLRRVKEFQAGDDSKRAEIGPRIAKWAFPGNTGGVNVPSEMKNEITEKVKKQDYSIDLFDKAYKEVYGMLNAGLFKDFINKRQS